MYFPVLEQLSNYNDLDFDLLKRIDSALYLICTTKNYSKRFSPRVYKYFGFELDESKWITTLDNLIKNNYLRKNFELCCSSCDETIETFHSLDDLPVGLEKSCPSCGEIFSVGYNDVFITYSFDDLFKPDSQNEESPFFRSKIEPSNSADKFSLNDLLFFPESYF